VQDLLVEDSSVVLLDVRTPEEFRSETGHLSGAMLIPVQELEHRTVELEQYKERTIIAYCRTGRRSSTAATLLNGKGFNVLNMTGGIVRWNTEQRPVVKGSK
jgi:rhodanese-related sulfurtransferase